MKLRLENLRANYVFLAEPREQMSGGMKYEVNGIFTPETKIFIVNEDKSTTPTTLPDVIDKVAVAKWKANGAKIAAAIEESKKCYRDGDLKFDKAGNVVEEYVGSMYIVAKNGKPPRLLNQARGDVSDPKQIYALFYSGACIDLVVDVYAYEKEGQGKSIPATLLGVQFRGDGDVFGGGGRASSDDFGAIEVPAEELA